VPTAAQLSDRSFIEMTSGQQTRYLVRGGNPLQGTVFVQGAKNAALKMIAASLMAGKGRTVLRNVPVIEDVRRAIELAQAVGAVCKFHEAEHTLVIDASDLTSSVLPEDIAQRFRGSVLFVPPLLHRLGEATIEGIGGCNLGSRMLDFHYRGFARLGATVDEGDAVIHIKANKLRGAHLYLDTPSHTGTENLIMAASLAPGTTVIDNAALEPEVLDVIAFLTKMGARISGGGTGFVTVEGVEELTAVEHTVMADRIDAGVFAMAAAMAGGELSLVGASLDHFGVARWKLEQMGVEFATHGAILQVRRDRQLRPINIVTDTFPGFATDLQSPIMALSCLADGTSYIRETIYDGRYNLVPELNKMGAKVEVAGNAALVHGLTPLHGSEVVATDLRAGIALILAGLAAEGETAVAPGYLIDRGHEAIATRLVSLGADIHAEVI
jgi:UDP-N-acetylglucosamine 1-carboxyvinyltransferase